MTNIKILCVGDPHIKESSTNETKILENTIVKTIKQHDPEIVVIMGDTLHNHEKINCTMQVIATKFFETILDALSQKSIMYVLIGNHDICDPRSFLSENHAFYSLKNKNHRLRIIDKPKIEKYLNYSFMFVPFVPNGRFREAYETITTSKDLIDTVSTIFCHQEFKGAVIENFISDAEIFSDDMPLCIAGHIHKYHVVSDNLTYVGTPYQHRFGEDTDKALMMLNYMNEEVVIERIRLENIPLKIKLIVSKGEFEELELGDFNKYKVEIYGYPEEIQSLKLSESYMRMRKKCNVKLLYSLLSNETKKITNEISLSFKKRLENSLNDPEKYKMHELICGKL